MIDRIRNAFFILILLIYILFEELIWENTVVPIIRYISAFHFYRRFLEYVQMRANRNTVLILFIVPFLIGEVVGVFSGILAAQLHLLSAALLYTCKIPLIVVALAILQNGKDKLLTFGWFALCYVWIMKQLDKLHESRLYRQIHLTITRIRKRFKGRSNRMIRRIVYLYHRVRYSLKIRR
jgi:hypothetical protein